MKMGYCDYYIIDISFKKEEIQYIWETSGHFNIIDEVDYLIRRLIQDNYFKSCKVKVRRCTADMANCRTEEHINAYILAHLKKEEVIYEKEY